MSRLEKKCLITSAGVHALLGLLLFVAPLLWVTKRPSLTLPLLNSIPSRLVDGAMSGGGSPTARAMPAPAPTQPTPPQVVVAPPLVKPPAAPRQEAQPAKEEPVATSKSRKKSIAPVVTEKKLPTAAPDETDDSGEVTVGKKKIHLDFTRATGTEKSNGDPRAEAQANARAAQAQFASRINQIVGAIGQGVSSGTSIDVPGPGGEAYADYGQFVELFYRRAWSHPNDLAKDLDSVKAQVVILRDGTVESFKIIKHSSDPALDKSVDRLKKLSFIAPFPPGANDPKRSFIINFILRPDQE